MKILLLWDYYPSYLRWFYARNIGVESMPYDQQYQALQNDFFAWPSYLVPHFQALGHKAHIIVGNAEPVQRAWALENDAVFDRFALIHEQIRRFKPDVLWIDALPHHTGTFLSEIAASCRLIVAWAAHAGANRLDLRHVSCVLTSHPVFIEQFTKLGRPSELLLPCFEPRVLDYVSNQPRDVKICFYGSLSATRFTRRIEMLAYLVRHTPLRIWSERPRPIWRPRPLKPFAMQFRLLPILLRMRGENPVYGLEVFRLLKRSKLAFNVHVDSAQGQAGNIRMFEATGMGALLLTERTPNLSHLFEPDREVVTYSSKEDAVEKINYFLEHNDEREGIAAAGQRRTLAEHNAAKCAEEFLCIVKKYLQ